jgi:hypothetical protein
MPSRRSGQEPGAGSAELPRISVSRRIKTSRLSNNTNASSPKSRSQIDNISRSSSPRKEKKQEYRKKPISDDAPKVWTSIRIFRKYLKKDAATGQIDASGITSAECYAEWLASRKGETLNPEKAFQRALTGKKKSQIGFRICQLTLICFSFT